MGMEAPTTRETLIRRFRGGDRLAWEEFYQLYEPLVRLYVRRFGLREHDVDDLVQGLFLKLRDRLAHFELDHGKGKFRAWLRTVVDNSVRDWQERAERQEAQPPPDSAVRGNRPSGAPFGADGERWRRNEWRRSVLSVVMNRVREEFAGREKTFACFEQLTLEGRAAKEVAAELGIEKVNNVYVYSHRVLQRVRQLCAEYDEELDDAPAATDAPDAPGAAGTAGAGPDGPAL